MYDVISDVTSGEEGGIDLVEVVLSKDLIAEIGTHAERKKVHSGGITFITL